MHKEMLPECEDEFKKLDTLKEDLYGKDGYLTNHIPSQIAAVKKFMFKSVLGLALTIISVLGGMTTALILLIAKGL